MVNQKAYCPQIVSIGLLSTKDYFKGFSLPHYPDLYVIGVIGQVAFV